MNALPKVHIGITFVKIECNLVIIWYEVTLLCIIPPILILESNFWYFFYFAEAGMLKTVQNYLSRCHGSREIDKTKVRIKLNETSLFTISNMVFSLHFCQAQPQLQLKLSLLGWVSFNLAKSKTHHPPTQNSSEKNQHN